MSTAPNPQTTESIALVGTDGYRFLGDNDTVTRKCAFITLYREHGSIYHAAKLTPVSRKTVYRWMEADPQFAEAMSDSKEDCVDDLETSVYKRAFTDNLLAMFYLKAHRHKFRDKVTIDVEAVRNEIEERMRGLGVGVVETLQISPPCDNQQKGELALPPLTTTTTTATTDND